ncbi:hypothetical protein [Cohnella silvisoli]|uniref:Uncharacterized protein n=1 Tax=Cohnella silvisoli TaxID=2873699 RepID=A0ABV1L2Y6_9BACL|nr:hypothetical protein [Cohnella silvisoli]MCD9026029.1 hypothetical protein [Cohnella silvisoli]
MSKRTIGKIIGRLVEKSAIIRPVPGKPGYDILLDYYEILDDTAGTLKDKDGMMKVIIPDGYEDYIRLHYDRIPRKELARRLNLDKFTLNMMLLQLGMGGL